MRQISRRDFETYEKIKKFMGENKLDGEGLRKYINREVHLKVSSKGVEPSTFKSLSKASTFIGVSRQTFEYAHKAQKNPSSLEGKVELKYSSSSGLSRHNIYPVGEIFSGFLKPYPNFLQVKMPHSDFKHIPNQLSLGVLKCPFRQTFDFASERD